MISTSEWLLNFIEKNSFEERNGNPLSDEERKDILSDEVFQKMIKSYDDFAEVRLNEYKNSQHAAS